ncbi:snoRNA-binding rRNA-processing protein [Tulasnella sp. 418]|nr:snoRNA-binding rRNA-processing protein [Tulasnella sp. 418]
MPRASKPQSNKPQHDPLYAELREDEKIAKYGKISQPGRRSKGKKRSKDEDELKTETLLDSKTSKRIFDLAKSQQAELGGTSLEDDSKTDSDEAISEAEQLKGIFTAIRSKPTFDEEEEEEEFEEDQYVPEEEYEELQIDEGDLTALDAFLPPNAGQRKTLADLIFEKFESGEVEEGKSVKLGKVTFDPDEDGGPPDPKAGVDPKVVAVYEKIGHLLNRYKSGPLPKPLKILPAIPAWARLLAITDPPMWTPHAFNAVTRVFISNLKPEQCRVYLEGVLLPALRENMQANQGKLNVHLYEAVKKSIYKPAAFFKGILFPMCEGGCTLKEASIIASIMSKVSIPILHSAAALLRLASMEYSGPNSLFIRVLLDKKYALPYKVVDGMVFHFIRLANTHRRGSDGSDKLPVLWHQSLLVFTQRYSSDLTPDQKDALLDVIRVRPHGQISPEIRRHLVNSVVRGEPRPSEDVDMA